MRQSLTAKDRLRRRALSLTAVLLLGCRSGVLLAAGEIGLPYAVVPAGPDDAWQRAPDVEIAAGPVTAKESAPETAKEAGFVEIAAGPVAVLSLVEVPPDPYSRGYRSGIDVYRSLSEDGFDNEPMPVVYARADPARALPDVVVTPASSDRRYSHITAAQRHSDPVALGEDRIHLTINTLPVENRSSLPLKPSKKRFFSQKQNPEIGF
ncbi:MAG: hypothetical protein ACI9W6_000617 [Motiliproteus sp.]|jgi:hypothetical protein